MASSVVARWWKTLTHLGREQLNYIITQPVSFAIPNGQTGAAVDPVVFPAHVRVIACYIEGTANIQAATNLTAEVAWDTQASTPLAPLYEQDDPGTEWSAGALPVAGRCAFILTHAYGIRQIRFVLSQVTTGVVSIEVYGLYGEY